MVGLLILIAFLVLVLLARYAGLGRDWWPRDLFHIDAQRRIDFFVGMQPITRRIWRLNMTKGGRNLLIALILFIVMTAIAILFNLGPVAHSAA